MRLSNNKLSSAIGTVSVVCFDAGGANLVFSFLANERPNKISVYVEGPAVKIFNSFFPNMQCEDDLKSAIEGANILISGTGWASDLEHDARKLAKSLGIKTVAILDHWINYNERFIRNQNAVYPDEIWVTDLYAFENAKKKFPNIPIKRIRNYYFETLVFDIQTRSITNPKDGLYILEPARSYWGHSVQGEFQALEFFKNKLDFFNLTAGACIKLRPHPSDDPHKYDAWIAEQKNLPFIIEHDVSLQDAISQSSFVVGCESFALAIALSAGKKVYCSLPPWAPDCRLPHKEIIHLKDWA
jgi:hypothetical protein